MKRSNLLSLVLLGWFLSTNLPGWTQIIPDNTLSNNSVVLSNGNRLIIRGGTTVGINLFHSFQEFSLLTGKEAFFSNSLSIENIISRVTGRSLSNIDGLIRANGTANLFLLNPNGIIFGPNASLKIGGSLVASTASSLKLADGGEFNALDPKSSVLTVSVPIGLAFGGNSGAIQVQGRGYDLAEIPPLSPFIIGDNPGLAVSPGQTLALVGGDVVLEGGILKAEAGRIELGAVERGTVIFQQVPHGIKLDYGSAVTFKDIKIGSLALVDASGLLGGFIQIYGEQVAITGGGLVLIRNLGNQPSGDVLLKARESLKIAGDVINPNSSSPLAIGRSSITTESLTEGKGGDINIFSQNLIILEGGVIGARGFGNAPTGNINIAIAQDLQLLGYSLINPRFFSGISAVTVGSGNSGNVRISAANLLADQGGQISASTLGMGQGGNLNVEIKDTTRLVGVIPKVFLPSAIATSTLGVGDGGRLVLNTGKLIVQDGARVDTSSFNIGSAGNLTINASKLVEVSGIVPGSINPSIIGSAVDRADLVLQQLFQLPSIPSGAAGEITLNSPRLIVKDGGLIAVRNTGIGNAGNLKINASSILLDNGGGITATTFSGEGGNIFITSKDMRLGNDSEISVSAGGTGNGGNVSLNTNTLVALENSAITANAFQGHGGNINIKAQGLFLSPDSSITASSQFGIDGQLKFDVSPFQVNPVSSALPINLPSLEELIWQSCSTARRQERFVVQGRRGIASNPGNNVGAYTLQDLAPLGQALGMERTADGHLRLIGCHSSKVRSQ